MNNVIELNLTRAGALGNPAMGIVSVRGFVELTDAIRKFDAPNAVAPGEWPNPHEGVTCDEDPRRAACDCPLVMRRDLWCEDCIETDRARWGHD